MITSKSEALWLAEAQGLFHFAPSSTTMYTRRDDLTMCGIATGALRRRHWSNDSDVLHFWFGQPEPRT